MTRIHHPSKRGAHLSLWLGLVVAIAVGAGVFYLIQAHAEKKMSGQISYLKSMPSESVLRAKLNKEQYNVMREGGTEPPFHNQHYDSQKRGIYVDLITGEPLFSSTDKFDSGLGLPSFTKPIGKEHIVLKKDTSHGLDRIEVRSVISDSHLGHLFNDGPPPTNQRYSVNSAALHFVPVEKMREEGYAEFLPLFDEKK
ncbi:MAG: peptide-methionine (R)-S-oxide reductase [Verrucomicrobiota bacterium]|jgi:methionine-R-sulfoxide reductase